MGIRLQAKTFRPSKKDGEMRIQVGPFHDASSKEVPRKEVLGAVASAIVLTALMGLALLILSLLLTPY
jgi:hypothetical protein